MGKISFSIVRKFPLFENNISLTWKRTLYIGYSIKLWQYILGGVFTHHELNHMVESKLTVLIQIKNAMV